MKFEKTWFSWINFIALSVISSAALINLLFFNFQSDISSVLNDPLSILKEPTSQFPIWASVLLSVFIVLFIIVFYVGIRRFRQFISTKVNIFRNDLVSDISGGALSLGFFVAGLFLRIMVALNNDNVIPFETHNAEDIFLQNKSISFQNLNNVYEWLIAQIYRFIGIRPEAYVWINLVLTALTIIFIYCIIRNLFGTGSTIVPMAFLCLSPKMISYVTTKSDSIIEYFICSFILLLLSLVLILLNKINSFKVWGTIVANIFIIFSTAVLPICLTGGLSEYPVFDFSSSFKFVRLFLPTNFEMLYIIILALIIIAGVSIYFADYDRISYICIIWLVSNCFYLFCENNWPSEFIMTILFTVIAGIGLDELLLSDVYDPLYALLTNPDSYTEVIHKPKIEQIEKTVIDNNSFIESEKLTAELTSFKENVMISEIDNQNIVNEELIVNEVEKPVKLIDNPLPVPKPHVKKEISFAFEPEDVKMHFDYDISSDDDFDI